MFFVLNLRLYLRYFFSFYSASQKGQTTLECILNLECKVYALQDRNAALNNSISRLKVENDDLKRRLKALERKLEQQTKPKISVRHEMMVMQIIKYLNVVNKIGLAVLSHEYKLFKLSICFRYVLGEWVNVLELKIELIK